MKFLMIDHYDSFTYNLYALIHKAGVNVDIIKNDEYKDASSYDALIFSPGPSNPDNAGVSLKYIKEYSSKKPILGVCLGLEIIGSYLGYEVSRASSIMHGKIDKIEVKENSLLFKGLPKTFEVVRYHSLSVKGAQKLSTSHSLSDNEIMSIEDKDNHMYGVQFHPESIKSEYGINMIKNFINIVENYNEK